MKPGLMLISPMLHQGGFERVCVTTAKLMTPYFDVTIVVFNSANIAYNVEGLKIIDLKLGVRKGKLQKLWNVWKRVCRLKKLKKELQPQIAYSFGPTANLVNALSKTGKEKVWLGLRNYTDVEETTKIKLFTHFADLMICCSKEIEQEIKEKFGFQKTAVLYNLYDVSAIRKEAEEKELQLSFGDTDRKEQELRYLVSMGRDDDMKGFWHIIKAFKLVHDQISGARLILLGAGTFEHYKKLSEELGIRNAIFFAGMQTEPYKYLKKGEIYLLTSGNEGFPNALVEGMTLALAPISVNCKTGPAEILTDQEDTISLGKWFEDQEAEGKEPVRFGEYGILLPAMSKERNLNPKEISEEEKLLAKTIITCMQDEKLLQDYQKRAEKRATEFSYETYEKAFLKLAAEGTL